MSLEFLNINVVLITIFACWHYALLCGYISDDHSAVEQRTDIIPDDEKSPKKESYWVKVFNDGIIVYYINRIMWKLGFQKFPMAWHAVSLAVHIFNSYLLYVVLRPFFPEGVLLCGILFWGINPMLNQNTVWISGRPYVFGFCLALLSMVYWQNPILFSLFYFLAVVTNISITFIPILIKILHPHAWQPNLELLMLMLIAAPFISWKFYRRFTKSLVIDRENFKFKIRKFNTFARIQLYYIYCLFIPTNMGWYHEAGFRYNEKWEKFNWITLLGYAVLFTLIFKGGMPAWWYLLCILPNSNLYATNSFVQDRYTYVASVGISLIVAPFLYYYPELFFCATTFYMTRSYMYSRQMVNDESMYRENWRNHSNSDYAVNNLSYFLIQQHRYEEARAVILRGIEMNRQNKMLWYNLGVTHAAEGHFKSDEGKFKFLRALDCWKMALQIEPRWTKPAEDIKKLIKILVDNKVLTLEVGDSTGGMSISIPKLTGMTELLQGGNV